jgi:hypothetical protein
MIMKSNLNLRVVKGLCLALLVWLGPTVAHAQNDGLQGLLTRAGQQTEVFLQQFSDMKCTEKVAQEKLGKDGKVVKDAESAYDYLVILSNTGGELTLNESRLALNQTKPDKQKTPLLVTNGFATLLLVFHPYYAGSFKFAVLGDSPVQGHRMRLVSFEHIHGTRSPAALSLRGKEYPLELSGKAWIDPDSGSIGRIVATIGDSLEDIGLKTMDTEVDYTPIAFQSLQDTYWYPLKATVEVETPRQHWRNTHTFSDYKLFSVSTEEKVANNK